LIKKKENLNPNNNLNREYLFESAFALLPAKEESSSPGEAISIV
jgi:hypothetical protein